MKLNKNIQSRVSNKTIGQSKSQTPYRNNHKNEKDKIQEINVVFYVDEYIFSRNKLWLN